MKSLFLFSLFFILSCANDSVAEKNIIARVGDETLTREALLFLAGNKTVDVDYFSRTINKWVEDKLLYDAALSIGLDKDLSLTRERDFFYESLLISSYIKIQTKEKTKTTKKEVSEYYLKNKESFKRTDEEVVVKHFVFSEEKEAKKLKKELKKKRPTIDIEELLKRQKVETKTIKKTDAGSNLVGFIFMGSIGDLLGPKKHNENFHLFQILQKHSKGSYYGLEKVYDDIYQRIYKEKEALVLNSVLDSLYLSSDVFVSQESLEK